MILDTFVPWILQSFPSSFFFIFLAVLCTSSTMMRIICRRSWCKGRWPSLHASRRSWGKRSQGIWKQKSQSSALLAFNEVLEDTRSVLEQLGWSPLSTVFQLLISFLACTGFNTVWKSLSLTCLKSFQVSTPRSVNVSRTNCNCSEDRDGISSINLSDIPLSMVNSNYTGNTYIIYMLPNLSSGKLFSTVCKKKQHLSRLAM